LQPSEIRAEIRGRQNPPRRRLNTLANGTSIATRAIEDFMSLVRLLGFTTLACGCVSGRYREVSTDREVTYIEEKGVDCVHSGHQRNQPVSANRVAHGFGGGIGRAS